MDRALLVAVVVGVVQGVFEWLPISSEGNVALALSLLGRSPEEAVAFALFLHLGTALSAAVYYRERIAGLLGALPSWRPGGDGDDATLGFLAVATVASGVVGIGAYQTVIGLVSETGGGLFVVAVGVLLVGTGLFQRLSADRAAETRTTPSLADAVLVGAGQGLAILPGVSRSGTTTGLLLLRGYEESRSFELSFLLSIPAALGAGVLAYTDTGLAAAPTAAVVALGVAAVVGYATIDALLRVVERVAFWAVCVGLGGLAVVGGVVLVV
ncbi:undecaprenyl-diphosphate phosphatase [Halobaculum sp. MBLA0143]|uniref:undecaprenyl-diphosphate phosphatase n=1 Tax=Halobaculum sp. MBLA0143 TaxID=3079933 RepID=UPI003526551A